MDKQTVLVLLSKPVRRRHFLLGKYLGLVSIIILVDVIISVFLALLCKRYGVFHFQQFLISQMGIVFESLILLALVIFFGVLARPVLTTLFALGCWVICHALNDIWFFSQNSSSDFTRFMGKALSEVLPNFEYFNFKEAVLHGDVISTASIEHAVLIWFAWSMILVLTSIWIFDRRDFI
jgi:ABC-type transport system involved in multi-copper enzyme maturation permease subunit